MKPVLCGICELWGIYNAHNNCGVYITKHKNCGVYIMPHNICGVYMYITKHKNCGVYIMPHNICGVYIMPHNSIVAFSAVCF